MATIKGHLTDAARKFTVKPAVRRRREIIRAEIAEALLSPLIDARLLTIAERTDIRREVRKGLSFQRWNKHYSRTGKNGNTVTQIPRGLANYSVAGRNDRTFNTDSARGSRWLGANEKALNVIP